MRSSRLYNEFLTGDRVRQLHSLYIFDYSLGDQDWFSELGFSHPNLFHILSCQFNRQTSIQVNMTEKKLNVKMTETEYLEQQSFFFSTFLRHGRWNLRATITVVLKRT